MFMACSSVRLVGAVYSGVLSYRTVSRVCGVVITTFIFVRKVSCIGQPDTSVGKGPRPKPGVVMVGTFVVVSGTNAKWSLVKEGGKHFRTLFKRSRDCTRNPRDADSGNLGKNLLQLKIPFSKTKFLRTQANVHKYEVRPIQIYVSFLKETP